MATTPTIKVSLQRDSLRTPWGFRLQGGADFRVPFTVNKVLAGSPAENNLQRGDIILEINEKPISSMLHADALQLIQQAGGQITFVVQRGSNQIPHTSLQQNQRPMSATPWTNENSGSPWSSPTKQLSPLSYFRNRPLERIPEPKPVLSQTGSPMMPGPLPSVSTKTRGYQQPPSFHTDGGNQWNNNDSYSPIRYFYPGPTYHNRTRTMSSTPMLQNSYERTMSRDGPSRDPESYVPSYQKKVHINPNVQTQHYDPSFVQPTNFVHRQFNSPMSLYSSDNVQEVLNYHINRVNQPNQDALVTDF